MQQMSGTNTAIGGGGFHHVALRVGDFERAVAFYTDALGCVPTKAWGEGDSRAVMLDTGDGSFLEVFAGGTDGPKDNGAVLHVALRSSDVDGAIERARAAGAEITVEPKDVDIPTQPQVFPVRIAFCRAPDGTIIEFFHEK
jgi:catechol 2,3-dioxygenase-like lactoylglutathione lyase family enzyme